MRSFKIYSLSNSQMYNRVLSTAVSMPAHYIPRAHLSLRIASLERHTEKWAYSGCFLFLSVTSVYVCP